jgi:hypothetical protein
MVVVEPGKARDLIVANHRPMHLTSSIHCMIPNSECTRNAARHSNARTLTPPALPLQDPPVRAAVASSPAPSFI